MSKSKTGRSAVTGRFTTVAQARNKPNTHVVETINRGGKGGKNSGKGKGK